MIAPRRSAGAWAIAAGLIVPLPAQAQQIGLAAPDAMPWGRVAGAFVVCITLAVAAIFVLRARSGHFTPSAFRLPDRLFRLRESPISRLALVETLRLSHQLDLCLVRYDDREVLLAATPHGAFVVQPREAAGAAGACS